MPIQYSMIGDGPEHVLVLHGWFGDHSVFSPIFPSLDAERFTYVFPDYRGYGKSIAMTGAYTVDEVATDALELADTLGWDRFHIVGHSMGGMVVQRLMVDAPQRVKSAVAITPVPASGAPLDEEGEKLFSGACADDALRAMIVGASTGNRLSETWVRKIVHDSRAQTTPDAFQGYMRMFTGTDFAAAAKGNKTPILVLPGECDGALTVDVMQQTFMKWYPNATLKVIGNAGHYPMQETPVFLATEIQKFFEAHA